MPCNSGQGDDHSDYDARRKAEKAIAEADKVTRILCTVLQALPAEFVTSLGPEVGQWMAEHKAHDAKQGRPW